MRQLYLLLFFAGLQQAIAQDFHITGKVIDAGTREGLEASTVYVERLQDSSMISYSITDRSGAFDLALDTREKQVKLFISYTGYHGLGNRMSRILYTWELGSDFGHAAGRIGKP